MLISCCSSGLFESQEGAGATTPTGVDVPFRRQLNGLLLPAEGAGRRLASLPGLRGVPEKLFVLFLRPAYGT